MSKMNFVYMNEDLINPLLNCKLCSKPFIDPVVTRDGERFCRICITQQSSINNPPNYNRQSSYIEALVPITERILLDMLDDLLVQCIECQQINIRRIQFQQHLLTECPKRIVLCKASDLKCSWSGLYEEFDDHMNKCTFQLLRPILTDTLQCQKQLEQYKISYDEQKYEIIQLKKQIEQYDDRIEKLQRGFKAFFELISQQKLRYERLENNIHEISQQFNEKTIRQNELRNEIQQLKEQYNQINILSNEFHRLNQSQQSNKNQQLDEQFQNEIQQLKEQFNQCQLKIKQLEERNLNYETQIKQFNQQMIQLNQFQLEIKQLQEHDLNYETQIKQLLKQDLSRKNENLRIRQICDQHQIQIHLLARKKCVVPTVVTNNNASVDGLIETFGSDTEIDLDGKQLNNQDMELVCKKAIVNKQCRKLRLENNDLTAKGVAILSDALYGNKTLVELHLSNNRISDMGVHALAQVLSISNWTLEWLELHSNNITDDGAEYLAEMLKTNKTLTLLGLSFNRISDRGVRLLTSAIAFHNETLQWLHLASNKLITDASVDNFIEMLKHNNSLQALWINDCSLSKDAVEKLKQITKSNTNFILEI